MPFYIELTVSEPLEVKRFGADVVKGIYPLKQRAYR